MVLVSLTYFDLLIWMKIFALIPCTMLHVSLDLVSKVECDASLILSALSTGGHVPTELTKSFLNNLVATIDDVSSSTNRWTQTQHELERLFATFVSNPIMSEMAPKHVYNLVAFVTGKWMTSRKTQMWLGENEDDVFASVETVCRKVRTTVHDLQHFRLSFNCCAGSWFDGQQYVETIVNTVFTEKVVTLYQDYVRSSKNFLGFSDFGLDFVSLRKL